jgi:hypothetical protein
MAHTVSQTLSLMIPRIFPQWVDEQKIIDIFHKQQLGRVYKVSIIRMPDSKKRAYPIYQAFVYFSAWYNNDIAYNFQQRIFGSNAQARVVYDDPWYWVAFENTKKRLSNNDKRIIRVAYQTYLAEQVIIEQNDRIRTLENYCKIETTFNQEWRYAQKNNEADAANSILGDELELTETAMGVAEAVLTDYDYNMRDDYYFDAPSQPQYNASTINASTINANDFKESRLFGWMN